MYDPSIGRWLEEDPIGFEASDANLYRYVQNGVTNAVDPTGLAEFEFNVLTGTFPCVWGSPGNHASGSYVKESNSIWVQQSVWNDGSGSNCCNTPLLWNSSNTEAGTTTVKFHLPKPGVYLVTITADVFLSFKPTSDTRGGVRVTIQDGATTMLTAAANNKKRTVRKSCTWETYVGGAGGSIELAQYKPVLTVPAGVTAAAYARVDIKCKSKYIGASNPLGLIGGIAK